MPAKVSRALSERFLATPTDARPWHLDLLTMLNRELLPLVRELRKAYNQAVGPVSAQITADETVSGDSQYHLVDATSGVVTLTLPSASEWKLPLMFKRLNSSGSNVVIAAAGSDLIDGASSKTLTTQYESVTLVSDEDDGWWVF